MSAQVRTCSQLLKKSETPNDNYYLKLHALFGEVFIRALELLDAGKFRVFATKTRKLLRVRHKNEEYTLFSGLNYCSCKAFKYQTLVNRKHVCCKHVLAGFLVGKIGGELTVDFVTEEQMSVLVKGLFEDFFG